jgi:hypothetical protein
MDVCTLLAFCDCFGERTRSNGCGYWQPMCYLSTRGWASVLSFSMVLFQKRWSGESRRQSFRGCWSRTGFLAAAWRKAGPFGRKLTASTIWNSFFGTSGFLANSWIAPGMIRTGWCGLEVVHRQNWNRSGLICLPPIAAEFPLNDSQGRSGGPTKSELATD